MNSVSIKSNSEDIRVYINGLLHIRVPRKPMILHSYIQNDKKLYVIELTFKNYKTKLEYDDKKLWTDILKNLDRHI